VLNQTLPPAQVIVVDDGSTDGTADVLKKEFGSDIILIRQENRGVAGARNTGLQYASQEFVGFLDSDDRWMPHLLETLIPVLQGDPELLLVYSNWLAGDSDQAGVFSRLGLQFKTGSTRLDRPLRHLLRRDGNGILLQSSLVRRWACIKAGGFDESYRLAEDTKLFQSLALLGPFAIWSEPLLIKIDEEGSEKLTQARSNQWQQEHAGLILRICKELGREVARKDSLAFLYMQRLKGYFYGVQCVESARQRQLAEWMRLLLASIAVGHFRLPLKSILAFFD
jgi:glycosyltransferase involved in cell wall biosynthesis